MNETPQDQPKVNDLLPFLSLSVVSQQEQAVIGRAIGDMSVDEIMPLNALQLTNRIEGNMAQEDKLSSTFSLSRFRIGQIATALLDCASTMLRNQVPQSPVHQPSYETMGLRELLEVLIAQPTMLNRIMPYIETLIPEAIRKTEGRWVVPQAFERDGVNINLIATVEYALSCNRTFRYTSPRVKTSNGVMIPITLNEALGENVRPLAHPYFKSPIEGIDEGGYDISGMDVTLLEIIAWAYMCRHAHYPQTQDYFDFMEEIASETRGGDRSKRWARITLDYEAAKVRGEVRDNLRFRTSWEESYMLRQRQLTGRSPDSSRAVYGGDHLDFRGMQTGSGTAFIGKIVHNDQQ